MPKNNWTASTLANTCGRRQRKKGCEVLFGDTDFGNSIHFIFGMISIESERVFDSTTARQVKSNHWALAP